MLYIPKAFNFRNIDGIIVWIAPKRGKGNQKLFMLPLQITLGPDKHSNSRKGFFSEWKGWTENLYQFDVVPEFLWISPKATAIKKHDEGPEWPTHVEL